MPTHNIMFCLGSITRGMSRGVHTITASHHLSYAKWSCSSGGKLCIKPISHRESVASLNHVSRMVHALMFLTDCHLIPPILVLLSMYILCTGYDLVRFSCALFTIYACTLMLLSGKER
ncbi:hypothetical protein BDN71DRAFT_1286895 [Pleurotus eryngii]|uniref:Uncharacterized protein n=1 Tax=Pleurotus eryngii TaxID=5323 RepID=A0A9P5ZNU8_PLEER|nr:hypothetical protein BDN71DRAFT_1286895 [Pleurotus eryngii]